MQLFHHDGSPRAHALDLQVLAIGRGAQNLAVVFPQVVVGDSDYLDDYDLSFLDQFDQLFLSGFQWRNRNDAEARVREFMDHGGRRVVVDLTGVANDTLSRRPRFLGVYGEPVTSISRATLNTRGQARSLLPFHAAF